MLREHIVNEAGYCVTLGFRQIENILNQLMIFRTDHDALAFFCLEFPVWVVQVIRSVGFRESASFKSRLHVLKRESCGGCRVRRGFD